jgi:hypothetical protein
MTMQLLRRGMKNPRRFIKNAFWLAPCQPTRQHNEKYYLDHRTEIRIVSTMSIQNGTAIT